MDEIILVVTTTSSREEAERIGRELVEQRLAACVQIEGPLTSIYRWQGHVETAAEWRLTAKSLGPLFPRLESTIRGLHSYDTPEILATPVVAASAAYREWLAAEVAPCSRGLGPRSPL